MRLVFFIASFLFTVIFYAQQPLTIKFKKESMATKAVFDNIEMKLIVMDKFGNITQIEIRNFKLFIKEKSATKEFESFSNNLTQDMLTHLNKLKKSTKLFFTNIYVEEHEHLEKLPDVIEIWFPVCK